LPTQNRSTPHPLFTPRTARVYPQPHVVEIAREKIGSSQQQQQPRPSSSRSLRSSDSVNVPLRPKEVATRRRFFRLWKETVTVQESASQQQQQQVDDVWAAWEKEQRRQLRRASRPRAGSPPRCRLRGARGTSSRGPSPERGSRPPRPRLPRHVCVLPQPLPPPIARETNRACASGVTPDEPSSSSSTRVVCFFHKSNHLGQSCSKSHSSSVTSHLSICNKPLARIGLPPHSVIDRSHHTPGSSAERRVVRTTMHHLLPIVANHLLVSLEISCSSR